MGPRSRSKLRTTEKRRLASKFGQDALAGLFFAASMIAIVLNGLGLPAQQEPAMLEPDVSSVSTATNQTTFDCDALYDEGFAAMAAMEELASQSKALAYEQEASLAEVWESHSEDVFADDHVAEEDLEAYKEVHAAISGRMAKFMHAIDRLPVEADALKEAFVVLNANVQGCEQRKTNDLKAKLDDAASMAQSAAVEAVTYVKSMEEKIRKDYESKIPAIYCEHIMQYELSDTISSATAELKDLEIRLARSVKERIRAGEKTRAEAAYKTGTAKRAAAAKVIAEKKALAGAAVAKKAATEAPSAEKKAAYKAAAAKEAAAEAATAEHAANVAAEAAEAAEAEAEAARKEVAAEAAAAEVAADKASAAEKTAAVMASAGKVAEAKAHAAGDAAAESVAAAAAAAEAAGAQKLAEARAGEAKEAAESVAAAKKAAYHKAVEAKKAQAAASAAKKAAYFKQVASKKATTELALANKAAAEKAETAEMAATEAAAAEKAATEEAAVAEEVAEKAAAEAAAAEEEVAGAEAMAAEKAAEMDEQLDQNMAKLIQAKDAALEAKLKRHTDLFSCPSEAFDGFDASYGQAMGLAKEVASLMQKVIDLQEKQKRAAVSRPLLMKNRMEAFRSPRASAEIVQSVQQEQEQAVVKQAPTR